jgi:lysophospholipase L1-like esterase
MTPDNRSSRGSTPRAPRAPESSLKQMASGFALLLVTLLFCAGTGEVAVRLFYPKLATYNTEMWRYASRIKQRQSNPKLPFLHGANRDGMFYGVEIKTNSFGFRDKEYPVARVAGRQRILMLGDSFGLGWGVSLDDTFSKHLERALNESGHPTDVINLGIGNYNTAMEVELFREKGLQFAPDLVVLMQYVNDAEPTPQVVSPLKASILTRSYLFAVLFDRYIKLKPVIAKSEYDWKAYYSNLYRPTSPGFAEYDRALRALVSLCKERGITLLVATIPELRELKPYPFPEATESVRSVASAQGVAFLDLLTSLAPEDPSTLWVTPQDPHANAKANRIIAAALYQKILEGNLLQAAPAQASRQ